ncbi:MAG: hypothetical protein CL946_01140 [Ectothiorhodospiraceae bacterium]|nr:hypothetical protein [Ectothiorhodospiraceae bacterium]
MKLPKLKTEWDGFKGYVSMTWDKISDEELVRVEGSLPTLINLIEEKYHTPKEKIEQKLEELYNIYIERKQALKEDITELRQDISNRSSELLGGIRDKSEAYTRNVRTKFNNLNEEHVQPYVDKSEDYIKMHPFTAVFGALGVGVLIGGIIGLLGSSRDD